MNFEENTVRYAQISAALSRSRFRSRFRPEMYGALKSFGR